MRILRTVRLLAFGAVIATAWAGSTTLRAGTSLLDECPEVFCGDTCDAGLCWAENETQCNQFQGCTFDEECEQGTATKAQCNCLACG